MPTPGTEPGRKQKKGLPARRRTAYVTECLFLLHAGGNEEELCIHKLCDRTICPIRTITQAHFRHPFSRNCSRVSESFLVIKTPRLVCIKILPSKFAPPALLRHTPHKANFLRDLTAVSSSDCLQQTHQVLFHGAVTTGSPSSKGHPSRHDPKIITTPRR
jgi:hypothetical protein